jgi:hypothetical protein
VSVLTPSDPGVLATAVVDNLVVANDPDARRSGMYYWELARPWTSAVTQAVRTSPDDRVRTLGRRLLADPGDPQAYRALRARLADRAADPAVAPLLELGWQAETNSRVGYHLGDRYARTADLVPVDELTGPAAGARLPAGADPEVLVVIPFRDTEGGIRLRNLLAALRSLRDQSMAREDYRVTVVECDVTPRWADTIVQHADTYLFAPKPGKFNRSWGVNTGVENSPGNPRVVCILDADVLADRDFLARNAARFRRPGTGGHLPYRNMTCLDPAATSWAIRQRLQRRAGTADADGLRGFHLRRPPGCCVWVRVDTFRRVGGMDERYEGWGGEDNDFAYRFDMAAPLDAYRDWLLHMSHPPVSELRDDGELVNAHIPALSWRPDGRIGRLDQFAPALTGSPLGG